MSTEREPWGQTLLFTRIASRVAAALSLAAVLAGGAVVGQWVLPIEVSRTADAELPAEVDYLEITAGPGVALHVINRERVNLPSGYHAVSTATFGAPDPVLNPDLPSVQAACPAVWALRCRIVLDVYVPGRLHVVVTGESRPESVVIDSDVDVEVVG
jgi:hypothetical protein